MNPIHSSILSTLAYFDLFDCPLTANELWSYLSVKTEYRELLDELDQLLASGAIYQQQGFYSLRPGLIIVRQSRYATSRRKLKKARLISKLLAQLPWVKFIGLANQIGQHNLRNNGDLDLFIITESGRLWTSRFFCASLMATLRQRPRASKSQDTICLSFFVSETNLNLKNLHLATEPDLYFIYWLANLKPLYDSADYYQKIFQNNFWLQDSLPNWQSLAHDEKISASKIITTLLKPLDSLENILKKWQMKNFPQAIKSQANTGAGVVISDQVLKLHLADKRQELMEKYRTNLQKIIANQEEYFKI